MTVCLSLISAELRRQLSVKDSHEIKEVCEKQVEASFDITETTLDEDEIESERVALIQHLETRLKISVEENDNFIEKRKYRRS